MKNSRRASAQSTVHR